MAVTATFKDFIKIREYVTAKYDYYARMGRFNDLSPEERLEVDECWKLIRDLKGFIDNVEENFEDPDVWEDLKISLNEKVVPLSIPYDGELPPD
tara:strand:+ start:579 stop:860 length:282 start_codon:yes stop_codon:yes gene_type:complete